MDSGNCIRIERRAFQRNGLMIPSQATEVNGKISFVFYVRVSDGPESQILPGRAVTTQPLPVMTMRLTTWAKLTRALPTTSTSQLKGYLAGTEREGGDQAAKHGRQCLRALL